VLRALLHLDKTAPTFLILGFRIKTTRRRKKMAHLKGGLITALITPFKTDGQIDYDSLDLLVKDQVKKGVDGLVISGTTGESPNLSNEEVRSLYLFLKERVPSEIQMIIGAGTNSTHKTVENIKFYNDLNPDAYLLATPYYNKPSQRGIFEHFKEAAEASNHDILLYDIPGRSIVEISVEITLKLSEISNIVGTKDATGNLAKLAKLKEVLPKDFLLLSGDDDTCADFIKQGGHGVISVLSHLVPEGMKNSFEGREDYSRYLKLSGQIFKEPNPCPVKSCLKMMGLIKEDFVRLPLVPTTEELKKELKLTLNELELIK
jgi:4-hydroxy-tetrahydrodipicolinate synthase